MSMRTLIESAFGPNFDLYNTVLQIPKDPKPTKNQIRKAYHKRALEYHPDKQRSNSNIELAKCKFQAVSVTYEILSNEQSRLLYDETGELHDDEHLECSENGVDEWKEVFTKMFGKVTTTDIDNFEQKYKHSEEERLDVLKYYKICKGNFDKMLTCVMLSEEEDIPRWRKDYIEPAIEKGEIHRFKYENKRKQKKKVNMDSDDSDDADDEFDKSLENDNDDADDDDETVTESEDDEPKLKKAKNGRGTKKKVEKKSSSRGKGKMTKKEKEAKEAADLMAKIQQNAIARRGQSFGSLMSSLESRYATNTKGKKKGKKKRKKPEEEPPDIPDDEFERIRASLKKNKSKSDKV